MLAKLLHFERRAATEDKHIVARMKSSLSLAKASVGIIAQMPIERRSLGRSSLIDEPAAEPPRGKKVHYTTIGIHHAMKG